MSVDVLIHGCSAAAALCQHLQASWLGVMSPIRGNLSSTSFILSLIATWHQQQRSEKAMPKLASHEKKKKKNGPEARVHFWQKV